MASTSECPGVQTQEQTRARQAPLWNVILLDDDDHTYDYVVRMMSRIFGMPQEAGMKVARTVDATGRAICMTVHKELAELKQAQIHAFGSDPLIPRCRGSMSAKIEPAEADPESGNGGERA
ncbi:MAG: ATP-dependent Clp protease adaptor ClpS [Phycisphaerales bacterium]|nr:ATP-dependent Clp protease adaptor ClpS [Phycisphaerales bacterium]